MYKFVIHNHKTFQNILFYILTIEVKYKQGKRSLIRLRKSVGGKSMRIACSKHRDIYLTVYLKQLECVWTSAVFGNCILNLKVMYVNVCMYVQ